MTFVEERKRINLLNSRNPSVTRRELAIMKPINIKYEYSYNVFKNKARAYMICCEKKKQ